MFIHFAFGLLGKQGKIEGQTVSIIEYILKEKRLKISKCKEFIPAFPRPGNKSIPWESFKVTNDGLSATFYPKKDPDWYNRIPYDRAIHFLPVDMSMICFIKISFTQLKKSTHSKEYGKFGIVLTDTFLKAKGINPVYYYTEQSLWNDPLIKKWNYSVKLLYNKEKAELEKEIVSYRKPATLFPSFKKSVIAEVHKSSNEIGRAHV